MNSESAPLKRSRAAGMLGLAVRARKAVTGSVPVESAVKALEAKLVVLAADASGNTAKHFTDICSYRNLPICTWTDKESMGRAVGRDICAAAAFLDEGMAKAFLEAVKKDGAAQEP